VRLNSKAWPWGQLMVTIFPWTFRIGCPNF
jgi:hypothetical protein